MQESVRKPVTSHAARSHACVLISGVLAVCLVACGDEKPEIIPATRVSIENGATTIHEPPASPNSAFLEWDAVPYPNLRGYRVYYGPDPEMYLQLPGQGIDVGNATSHTITGLASGRRYYFAVTAVDHSGNESEFSEQVYKDIP